MTAISTFETGFRRLQNGNDVRGAAIATEKEPLTLTPQLAAWIAKAFARFLAETTGKPENALKIGLGHDSRITAAALMQASALGLSESRVFDCGLITTPAMFQSVILPESDFDGSIMITASHLPFNRNGLKFFTKQGAISHGDLDRILDIAIELARPFAGEALPFPEDPGSEPQPFDLQGLYSAHMKQIICDSVRAADYAHPLAGLHIVVDSGNGASGFFATDILETLGADISGSQFLDPDGHFPNHIPNPENETAMLSIREAVLAAKADLGVIFDCDGDRGAVVFADGTEVNRNTLIALLSAIVAETAPGSWVVTDSVTSDELADFLENDLHLHHLRYRRGYKNVIDRGIQLNEEGSPCELAIETSGHGAFRENHFSDDGAYIAVKIICRMARMKTEGGRIEDLIRDLKQPAEAREVRFSILTDDFAAYGQQVLADFTEFCKAEPAFHIVEPNYEGVRISFDLDGVRGWVLVRMSLHDPVLPVNLESSTVGGCDKVWARLMPFWNRYDKLQA